MSTVSNSEDKLIEAVDSKEIKNTKKKYHCIKCDKSFAYASGLSRCLGSHSKKKVFICQICGMNFKNRKDHLKLHTERVHNTKKPGNIKSIAGHKGNVQTIVICCTLCKLRFENSAETKKHIQECLRLNAEELLKDKNFREKIINFLALQKSKDCVSHLLRLIADNSI